MEARPPHPVPQSGRSHMQETFSPITVDLPAEILIPTLLYNPLPLQCLAADALPKQIKEEIDQITSEYGDMDSELLKVSAVSEMNAEILLVWTLFNYTVHLSQCSRQHQQSKRKKRTELCSY